MTAVIAITLSLIFMFLSFIHVYWMFGGKWGNGVVIPTKDDNATPQMPGFLPTFIVALGLFAIGVYVFIKTTILDISFPLWLDKFGLWTIAGIFSLRALGDFRYVGYFKKVRHTKFGQNDTKYYSPLCLLIGILAVILELNT